MAGPSKESAEDAITEEEMAAATPSRDPSEPNPSQSRQVNACTECSL